MGITRRVISEEARERRRKEREERKKKAIAMHSSGCSIDIIAKEIGVKPSTVRNYLREWRREGYPTYSISSDKPENYEDITLFFYFLKFLIITSAFFISFVKFGFGGGLLISLILAIFSVLRLNESIGKTEFYLPILTFNILLILIDNINLIQGLAIILFLLGIITLPITYLTRKGYKRYLP